MFTGNLIAQSIETKISGYAQGTTYHINYIDPLHRNFENDIADLLLRFDASLSTYVPTSIISRINANDKHVHIDSLFVVCFKKAKEVWLQTNGAFDPTVYPIVNAWGFGPGKKEKIEKEKIDSILKFVGFHLIELKGNKIIKKDPRVALDFNAFAQGYSVDVVSEFLNSKGIYSYIVEIGGEVY
ncbi:MAG: FAD:protein FMN transferase, partial [Chitinophagia bacterium]|nr:FAD:protein FMN transferase [Chitinophagia bacterium]